LQTKTSGGNKNEYPFTIFPNPFLGSFLVFNNDFAETFTNNVLKLYNLLGQEIKINELDAQITRIVSDEFNAGIYFYKISNQEKIVQFGRLIAK